MAPTHHSSGAILRGWRQRRRLSQAALAENAGIAVRRLRAAETDRGSPDAALLRHLAECLALPPRERDALLVAAGLSPAWPERSPAHPALRAIWRTVQQVLITREPNPAVAFDRHWTLVAANPAAERLTAGVDPLLLAEPINFLRLNVHPAGLAPRIINLAEWRRHLLDRLRRQMRAAGDATTRDLLEEVENYPTPAPRARRPGPEAAADVAVPLRLATIEGPLTFVSVSTVFDGPLDVTLAELTIESWFPADAATAALMAACQPAEPREPSHPVPRAANG